MIASSLLSVLFPTRCAFCGRYVEPDEEVICDRCLAALPRTEQALLPQNSTEDLFRDMPHFCQAAAFLFYERESPLRRAIHQMKYSERPQVAYRVAQLAAKEFEPSGFLDYIDIILPVPLHPKRFRLRGYNQSEWIARGLSDATGIPISTEHLLRTVDNPKQALLQADQRSENVRDIFSVSHPEELYHKHILLVDDIITTGSTIRSCLHTMLAFRGSTFSVFALGKAH